MLTRKPFVAGSFYEQTPARLTAQIRSCFLHPLGPGKDKGNLQEKRATVAAVLPHAGYMFSGPFAAKGYFALSCQQKPEGVVLLGPDHRAAGNQVSVSFADFFQTPLGNVPIQKEWAKASLSCPVVEHCEEAHRYEHSLEVHLPFLQYIYGEIPILPLTYYDQSPEVAQTVAEFLLDFFAKKDILVIASSDCSHYVPEHIAKEKDAQALHEIRKMNGESFYKTVVQKEATFCGYGPIITAILFAKRLGVREGELLAYGTSADTGSGRKDVVGYTAVLFNQEAS